MEMIVNNTLFYKGKDAFLNNLFKDSEYYFFNSYKQEKNQKGLAYYLYLQLLSNNYEKISKIYENNREDIKGFGFYSIYWAKYMEGDFNEVYDILDRMLEEEHYFIKIFAIKELSKFGKIKNLEETIKDRLKYFGLSYDFPLEEQRASIILDYLSKRYHLALIQSKTLLKDNPENNDLYLDYLEICFNAGTEDTIKEALNNPLILEMAKKDPRIMLLLAQKLYQFQEYEKSKNYLNFLIGVFNTNPVLYYNLGNIHLNQQKYIKAIENYEKAIEFAPLFDKAFYNLAICYFQIGEINKAIKNFEKSISISKNPKAIYNMAICLIERKDYEEAYHYLNKIPNWYNAKNSPFYLKEKIKEILFDSLIS